LIVGDHALRSELPPKLARQPRWVSGPSKLKLPFELPDFTLNPLSIRVVNAYIKHTLATKPAFDITMRSSIARFVRALEPCVRAAGFTQYQFVVPFEDGLRRMREILTTIMSSGQLPFLNVLKRFGPAGKGVLSFPRAGYTFAIDFPVRRNIAELIRRLDAMVLDAGGRIYLAKMLTSMRRPFARCTRTLRSGWARSRSMIPTGFSCRISRGASG